MTNNQLTSTHLAVKSELDGYKIHASRGQATAMAMVRLFESIDRDLEELQERRQATMNSEPVAWRRFQETPNDGGYWILYDYKPNCSGVEPLYRHAQQVPVAPVCTCPSGNGSLRWPCPVHPGNSPANPGCWCRTCRPVVLNDMRFVVCPDCGNKRCPRANDHRNACAGSNEPGQEGSAYPDTPQEVKGE